MDTSAECWQDTTLRVSPYHTEKYPPVKDAIGLKTPGIYRIPCNCGTVYIGQSGRPIHLRLKEHDRHIRLAQPEKSAVAEHSFYLDHIIRLQETITDFTNPI
jgi:hypothetical protein